MSFLALLLLAANSADIEWPAYGNDPGGARYSAAGQIDPANVASLAEAWSFATKDLHLPQHGGRPSLLESTPLYADGVLYATSAWGRVFALDPATGAEKWSYDPKIDPAAGWGDFTNRGVALHRVRGRITVIGVTIDARLFALDGRTGRRLWEVNLREGLRLPPRNKAEYEETSPPCVIGDVVVAGSAVADNGSTHAASGEVRGFDVRTGRKLWTWDPVPGAKPGEGPGGANAWSVIVGDPKRGLVFVPTGSPSPDYYGGERKRMQHGNSVVALDARTGRMVWSFQTVHHDLWDYDVASPPLLLRVKGREAVAVGSKTGHVFLLDRMTGKPLFPVQERTVPRSDAEESSARQPFPVKPPALVPQTFLPWGPTEEARRWCEEQTAPMRNEGIFTPPSLRGSVLVPGNIGGLHWGGFTWDRERRLLIAPANNIAAVARLIPREQWDAQRKSDRVGLEWAPQLGTPYGVARQLLLSPAGLPCNAPPWGTLSAIDTETGDLRWQVPLGQMGGFPGAPNLGGPVSTAGGLTFIGAAMDGYFRAFETATGKELWKVKLPAGARSTPMTYMHRGRQYVLISAGGHDPKFGPMGDRIIAFALPSSTLER